MGAALLAGQFGEPEMRVAVQFQFYFPFVLPRGRDWDGQGIAFEAADHIAKVRPRRSDEDLFPGSLDRTLSSMTITLARLSLPTSDTTATVRDICRDRLEVVVEGDVPSIEDARRVDVQGSFELRAIRAANLFLDHLRVAARSPFLTGVQRHFRVEDGRHYVLTPRTEAWFDGETGERLPVFQGDIDGRAASGAVQSPERGGATMEAIRRSLSRDARPDLAESLLLDAEAAVVTLRIREALLAMGTACEVASDRYIESKGARRNQQVRNALHERGRSFAVRRFDSIPTLLSNRSLSRERPSTFDDVERMYRSRNTVAHEGRACCEESGEQVEVDADRTTRFLRSARDAVVWIASL